MKVKIRNPSAICTASLAIMLFALLSVSCRAQYTVISSATFEEAEPGGTVTLSASVRNLGDEPLGERCSVWFRVQGPGSLDRWAGSADCSNQEEGTRRRYRVSWKVPDSAQAGTYSYWSEVYLNISNKNSLISGRSGSNYFLVVRGTAQAYDLDRLDDAFPGRNLTFSARVRETGDIDVNSGCEAWFEVTYPDGSRRWVGNASCRDISSSSSKRYRMVWMVPLNAASGRYYYRVKVYQNIGGEHISVSDYSEPSYFNVERGTAQILAVEDVGDSAPGANVTLSARVKSAGDISIRDGCEVWFKVTGPGGLDRWVAYVSCSDISEGSAKWYKVSWNVPLGAVEGEYSYTARVYQNALTAYFALSGFSESGSFNVLGNHAQVSSIRKAADSDAGENITFSAAVKNTGRFPFSQGCAVWFKVNGPGIDRWVASTNCMGQIRYSTMEYEVAWQIPASARNGSYSYWVRVYEFDGQSYHAISDKSDSKPFRVG